MKTIEEVTELLLKQLDSAAHGENLEGALVVCKTVDSLVAVTRLSMDYAKLRKENPAIRLLGCASEVPKPFVKPLKPVKSSGLSEMESVLASAIHKLSGVENVEFSRQNLSDLLIADVGEPKFKTWNNAGSVAAKLTEWRSSAVLELVRRDKDVSIYKRGPQWATLL